MGILVAISLIIKAIGASLEIAAQSVISQMWSVESYGTYSFFVSLSEGFYGLFFAGIIKLNNYFIPQGVDVNKFRKRFYLYYAIPIIAISLMFAAFNSNMQLFSACVVGFVYMKAMDISSQMMSYGNYRTALFGEYLIGRIALILLVSCFWLIKLTDMRYLYLVYGLQFVFILVYYAFKNKKIKYKSKNKLLEVSTKSMTKKYLTFQSTEIAHMVIMQSSIIVQYIFGGAFQTALVSIVLIVRKLINFISGPTSKLYQPEFSKKFNAGDKVGLAKIYSQITAIQLCFMMPAFSFLIAKPTIILKLFNNDLIEHGYLVQATSFVFLFMIAFGPLSNFLSMTGNEKNDTVSNWTSVLVMYITMFLFRQNYYFVVIGFCVQIIFSTVFKLVIFIKYLHSLPMPLINYVKLTLIFILSLTMLLWLSKSLIFTLLICVVQFFTNITILLPKQYLSALKNKFNNRG